MIELMVFLTATLALPSDPGITPDNPLYFLDLLFDEVKMFIASLQGAEALAKVKTEVLNERLAELYVMATENKTDKAMVVLYHINKLVEDFKTLTFTHPHVAGVCMRGLEVAERVLNTCMDICPEKAKYGLQKAVENVERCKELLNETIRERMKQCEQCRECWRKTEKWNYTPSEWMGAHKQLART